LFIFENKFFFLKIQNDRKIQYGRFFAQKFMISVLIFEHVILLARYYCKKFVVSPEKIKMASIFKMVSKMFMFISPNILKMIFLSVFFLFFYILGKNKTFMEKLFLENLKWRNNLIWKMIFFKKFQDFIRAKPLNEMFSFFDVLQFYNKIKSMLPSQHFWTPFWFSGLTTNFLQ
jgi:hypothetical protein